MFGRLPSEGIEENQIEILIENQKQRKQGILSTKKAWSMLTTIYDTAF